MTLANQKLDAFIARWKSAGGTEIANYQLFLTELCALLELPQPDPASDDTRDNAYVFQRRVTFRHGDGTESNGFIDLYRRGSFVLEAKKLRQAPGKGFDDALLRARSQGEQYCRALPSAEGRPPFLLVVDVGNIIELYSEFSRSGATYTPFPDPRSHRIRLDDLREPAARERLRQIWLDPLALDPSRAAAKVTREIAARLAELARSLETAKHSPEAVAGFLTRCLFTLFAEDVGLLPKRAFSDMLESLQKTPQQFVGLVGELWRAMDAGAFSAAIRADLLRFNGKLFKNPDVIPLNRDQMGLLLQAAKADWAHVEPAIFGTLLERALDPQERHSLGAHYTPRAYVERLVLPTVIEPLRDDWKNAQAAALTLAKGNKLKDAAQEIRTFHRKLCEVRVLDPACGSGNFLYVTLEHLKRLEGEIILALTEIGAGQADMDLEAKAVDPLEGRTVDPHQFLGLELNPRAAAIAELVLWIGYLQWHFRTRGQVMPPQPVLKDFRNIECRDAVLAYERMDYATDERGVPLSRWDGRSYKKHPVTGEDVPDERAQVPREVYLNPRKAQWPAADFVVGNPPFIGTSRMRDALGDGYTEALRATWPEVPESSDFVMYWWHNAAELTRAGKLRRFGLITTNSLRQTFNRRVLEQQMAAKLPLSLAFAIPDHPWVDSAGGAAVRIAMTVAQAGEISGRLLTVTDERESGGEGLEVTLQQRTGRIHADLTAGANVAGAGQLLANSNLTSRGVMLFGAGFIVTREEALKIGLGRISGIERHIRPYLNGKDLTATPRNVLVIDLYGLVADEVRNRYPEVYQWVLERVKPERDQNRDAAISKNWWLHGRQRPELRSYLEGLPRYIATVETSKHRFFVFLGAEIAPDNKLIAVALKNAFHLGVLSSQIHVHWALATGSTLEDRPVYVKTTSFETFPFPAATEGKQTRIRDLAEQLDAHRKRQQAQHPTLTLTGIYNVLEKLKHGESLTAKEKTIHEQGLVAVLKQLHDELDLAVLDAYGWNDLAPLMQVVNGNSPTPNVIPAKAGIQRRSDKAKALDSGLRRNDEAMSREDAVHALDEALLERLVALNTERAAEEKRGLIRWLRPEFQNAAGAKPQTQTEMDAGESTAPIAAKAGKPIWPKTLAEQARAVALALSDAGASVTPTELAARFKGARSDKVEQLLETLVSLGQARLDGATYRSTNSNTQ